MLDVGVHFFRLDSEPSPTAEWLSRDELDRAAKFVHASDGARFAAGRAVLRAILARYCAVAPQALEFGYGAQGKPFVRAPRHAPQFNMSHANEHAVLAVARHCHVGVDLECLRPFETDFADIATQVLTWCEYDTVLASPAAQRSEAFLRFWTAKEAVLKLLGTGLSIEPREVAVDLRARQASLRGQTMHLTPLAAGAGKVATLATMHRTTASQVAEHATLMEPA